MWGEGDQLLESSAEVLSMERLVRDFD